jgi:adenylate kinase family enzyme
MIMEPITAVFFGISGSGKGTQCEMLAKHLAERDPGRGIVRPAMGDLARAFMESGTFLGNYTRDILAAGGLLASFVPIYLLTEFLNKSFTGKEHLILDGTCRRPMQSQAVDEMARVWGRSDLHGIVLNLSPEAARARLKARGRYDDQSEATIAERLAYYEEHVVPAINALRECGWTVDEIDGGLDVETVHKNILAALGLQ